MDRGESGTSVTPSFAQWTVTAPIARVLKRGVRIIPIFHSLLRCLVRRAFAVMPESNPLTPVMSPPTSRTPAHDSVSRFSVCQSSRFAPDSAFFMCHSRSMMKNTTALMTVISALITLLIAHVFHTIAVMPVITARMIVIIALMSPLIRVMPIITARMIVIMGVMPIIIRIVWRIIRDTWLISGELWLTKNELSDVIGELTDPDLGSNGPSIAAR